MPRIPIVPPIKTVTTGGMDATIYEIIPDDLPDGLSGIVDAPALGRVQVSWNESGFCRDSAAECNLNPNAPELAAVLQQLRMARP